MSRKRRGPSRGTIKYASTHWYCEMTYAVTGRKVGAHEVHHILGGAYGKPDGPDDDWNRLAVTATIHRRVHAGGLSARLQCIAAKGDAWDAEKAAQHGWLRTEGGDDES